MEIFGRSAAIRNTVLTALVNSILNLCSTNAVMVPVMIVPKQETARMIRVFKSPCMTLPFTKAILKFSNCGTSGRVNTPVEIYSSCVLNAPISTTIRGMMTMRQHMVRKMYFRN